MTPSKPSSYSLNAPVAVPVLVLRPLLVAVEDDVQLLRRQVLAPACGWRSRAAGPRPPIWSSYHMLMVPVRDQGWMAPSARLRLLFGHDQLRVDLQLGAQAGAVRAGAVRAVEAEGARRDLAQADAAVDAGEVLGEEQLLAVDDGDQHHAGAQLEGRLDRVGHAALAVRLPGPPPGGRRRPRWCASCSCRAGCHRRGRGSGRRRARARSRPCAGPRRWPGARPCGP